MIHVLIQRLVDASSPPTMGFAMDLVETFAQACAVEWMQDDICLERHLTLTAAGNIAALTITKV